MTKDEINAMPAGRQLDSLIGYHLFGWRWRKHTTWDVTPDDVKRGIRSEGMNLIFDDPPFLPTKWKSEPLEGCLELWPHGIDGVDFQGPRASVPRFSTDIAAAWQVIEKLGVHVGLLVEPQEMVGYAGSHVKREKGRTRCSIIGMSSPPALWAETTPLAICRAALLATITTLQG